MASIIPITIQETGDVIHYHLKELPAPSVLVKLFKTLNTELYTWIKFAFEYYNRGDLEAVIQLLETSHIYSNNNYPDHIDDEIRGIDILAASYMKMANSAKTEYNRKKYLTKITKLYNRVDKVILYNENHLLGIIFVRLLEDHKIEEIEEVLDDTINNAMDYLSPQTARACIEFKRETQKNAFRVHRQSLNERPINLVNAQTTLANYFLTHGKIEKARLVFENALKSKPGHVDALIGLMITRLNSEGLENIDLYANNFKRFVIKREVMRKINDVYFQERHYEQMEAFTWDVFNSTMDDDLCTESFYSLGRIHAKKKQFRTAKNYFEQAIDLEPRFLPAVFGLGHVYMSVGDIDRAIESFEYILHIDPDSRGADMALDVLYVCTDDKILRKVSKLLLKEDKRAEDLIANILKETEKKCDKCTCLF